MYLQCSVIKFLYFGFEISPKFVTKGPTDDKLLLVQVCTLKQGRDCLIPTPEEGQRNQTARHAENAIGSSLNSSLRSNAFSGLYIQRTKTRKDDTDITQPTYDGSCQLC